MGSLAVQLRFGLALVGSGALLFAGACSPAAPAAPTAAPKAAPTAAAAPSDAQTLDRLAAAAQAAPGRRWAMPRGASSPTTDTR